MLWSFKQEKIIMKKYKIILNYLLIFSLFVFGFIIPFATNGDHINCNSNGNCQYYDYVYYFKTDKTSFKINNNSKISCVKTLNRQDRYNLFVNTDNDNVKLPAYLSLDRCNSYKNLLEENLSKSDKTLKYKKTMPINMMLKLILQLILIMILSSLLWGVFPFQALKYFSKPQNIDKQIINPWFNIFLLWLLVILCFYIGINKKLSLLFFCAIVFVCVPFTIMFSAIGKGANFRDNYSKNYPQTTGFADRLFTWNKLSDGAIYFTNNEIIIAMSSPKYMDLHTDVIAIKDVKVIKKSRFSQTIFIYTSNNKYSIASPRGIKSDVFINWMNETIEKIRTEK